MLAPWGRLRLPRWCGSRARSFRSGLASPLARKGELLSTGSKPLMASFVFRAYCLWLNSFTFTPLERPRLPLKVFLNTPPPPTSCHACFVYWIGDLGGKSGDFIFKRQDLFVWTTTAAPGAYYSFLLNAGGCVLHSLFHSCCVFLGINDSILQSDNVVMLFLFRAEKL